MVVMSPSVLLSGPHLPLLAVCAAWGSHQGQAEEHCTAPPSEEGALLAHILSAGSSEVGAGMCCLWHVTGGALTV